MLTNNKIENFKLNTQVRNWELKYKITVTKIIINDNGNGFIK